MIQLNADHLSLIIGGAKPSALVAGLALAMVALPLLKQLRRWLK